MAGLAPQGLVATSLTDTSIDLSWSNTSNSLGIRVFRKAAGGAYSLVRWLDPGEVDYTNSGLSQSVHYYYKLIYDGETTYSNEADTWTYPTAPSALAATFVGLTATLTWTNNGTYTYIYYQKKLSSASTWDAEVAVTGTLATVDVAVSTESVNYDFRIRAYRSDVGLYSGYSTSLSNTSGLNAPTGLSATCPTTTSCDLAWTDNSTAEDGYQIVRDDVLIDELITAEMLLDGGMETWPTEHGLYQWSESTAGTSSINKESSNPHGGTYCARLDIDASNDPASISQNIRLASGFDYALSLYYKTEALKTAKIQLYDTAGLVWLDSAGEWKASSQDISLSASTSWTSFSLNFTADNTHNVERLTNGNMESWSSATNLDSWTESTAGTSTVNKETTDPHSGTYCTRIDVDASNSEASITQAVTTSYFRHVLSFWYKTDATKTAKLKIFDTGSHVWMDANGTFSAVDTSIVLPATTAWKNVRISISPGDYTSFNVTLASGSATSGSVWFDDASVLQEDYGYTLKLSSDSAASGKIWWDDASIKSSATGEYNDYDLNAGTEYAYDVRAVKGTSWDEVPTSFSAYASTTVTTGAPPDAIPVFVSAVANTNKTVTITWVDTATNATAFYVYRSTDDVTYTELGSVEDGVQTYVDSTGDSSTKYYYKVKAYNESGYSEYSSATVDPGLEAWDSATSPTSWTATVNGTSTVNKESDIVHGGSYSCRLDIDSSNSVASIDQAITLVAGKSYVANLWYRTTGGATALLRIYDDASNTWLDSSSEWQSSSQDIALVSASAWTNFKIEFTASTYTAYKIYLANDSATSCSIAFDDVNVYGFTTTVADLDPPTNITATVVSATQIKLDFTNNSPDADALNVESKVYGGSYSAVTTTGTAVTYTKGSLTEGLTYMFRIRASVTVDAVTTYGEYSAVVTVQLIYSETSAILTNETYVGMGNILAVATTSPVNTVDCYMITKPFSYEDKDSDMENKWAITDRVHLDFMDLSADTPMTLSVSTDGGVTWEQSVTLLMGTGDGTHKCFDFWYYPVHGQKHTFKLSCNDSDTLFSWTGFDVYYEPTSRLFEMGRSGT